jgi:hypothetical protein
VTARVGGDLRMPPGGLVLVRPQGVPTLRTQINGKSATWEGDGLHLRELPAVIGFDTR